MSSAYYEQQAAEIFTRISESRVLQKEELKLTYLNIHVIPDLSTMTWVKLLWLDGNKLTKIQKDRLPPNLTGISLEKNSFDKLTGTDLPKAISELSIKDNFLEEFDGTGLDNLTYLDLTDNDLRKISNLPQNLDTLLLQDNKFKQLDEIPDSVTKFNISNNELKKLPKMGSKIDSVNACDNLLESIDGLPDSVVGLNISNNTVQSIDDLPRN